LPSSLPSVSALPTVQQKGGGKNNGGGGMGGGKNNGGGGMGGGKNQKNEADGLFPQEDAFSSTSGFFQKESDGEEFDENYRKIFGVAPSGDGSDDVIGYEYLRIGNTIFP
jgi:hypothetical protein